MSTPVRSSGHPDIGLCLPQLGPHANRDAVRSFCREAEALGFASLWVQEHLYFSHADQDAYAGRPGLPMPDPYRSTLAATELLAAAAAWTEDVVIGTSVLVAGYHRPVELAQRLATLDVLSGGRLVAGLGIGWSAAEHAQMDVSFTGRGRRTTELVEAVLACWGPDPVRFDGEFFTIDDSDIGPKPVQRPHPPLLGGMRSTKGLERISALFDLWNPSDASPADIAEGVATIAAHRDPERPAVGTFLRLFLQRPTQPDDQGGLDRLAEEIARARKAEVDHVIIDANFDRSIDSPASWSATPTTLAPLLEAS